MERYTRVMKTELPYALADGKEAVEIASRFNEYVAQNHPGCPTLEGKVWVDKCGCVLFGSTPDARAILANKVVTGDLAKRIGFHVANHQELARAYNDEKAVVESGNESEEQYFFNKRFAFDNGLWIVSPYAKGEINQAAAWNHLFAANVFEVMGRREVFAVPDEAIDYLPSANGQIPIRFIARGKEGLVIPLDWSEEDTRGFNFHTFDLKIRVPQKGSNGKTMNRFHGLREDVPTSALCSYDVLDALGYRDFDFSSVSLRVVFNIGEADRA